jgi:hypothetical protein
MKRVHEDQMKIEDLSEVTKMAIGAAFRREIADATWKLKIDQNFEHKIHGLLCDLASTKIGATEMLAALIGAQAAIELTDLCADLAAAQRGICWERDEHRLS